MAYYWQKKGLCYDPEKKLSSFISIIPAAMAFTVVPDISIAGDYKLYRDFRYSFNHIDDGTDSTLAGKNNASRLGLKGKVGEKQGVEAFYHFQFGFSADTDGSDGEAFGRRFALAGLKGGFGKVYYGLTSTPYKMLGFKMDPFCDTSAGTGYGGSNFGLSPLNNGWTNSSLIYNKTMNYHH